jgi:hypothetical protein
MAWVLPVGILVFGGMIAAIPIGFGVYFHRRAAAIGAMRITRIANLRSGIAKIKARVLARERLLRSPLSGQPCVYYRFTVEEARSGGYYGAKGQPNTYTYRETVIDDAQAIDVLLEDETGQADVDLQAAEVTLKSEQTRHSGLFHDPPERLKRVLQERYGKSTRGLLFNKSMSYTELFLQDGATVVVVGEVVAGRGGRPQLVGGAVPLMVSDKGSKKVGSPYRRRALYCYWGAAAIVVAFSVLAFCAGALARDFARNAPPEPQAADPAPAAQPPPGPGQ